MKMKSKSSYHKSENTYKVRKQNLLQHVANRGTGLSYIYIYIYYVLIVDRQVIFIVNFRLHNQIILGTGGFLSEISNIVPLFVAGRSWLQTIVLYLFQFLTFAERLANVNIDVIHRIDRTGSYAEVCSACNLSRMTANLICDSRIFMLWWLVWFLMQEVETYFSEGLTKWRDLNLTEHFSTYKCHIICCIIQMCIQIRLCNLVFS